MDDDYQLNEAAAQAMEDALRHSTVAVVSGSDRDKWTGLGAGTLIRWKGRELVLTASHVIEQTRLEDLRFFLPLRDVPENTDRSTLLALEGVETSKLFSFSELLIHGVARDTKLDLAAVDITGALAGNDLVTFIPVDAGGKTPTERKSMISRGFPHDLARTTSDNTRVVFMFVHWTEIVTAPSSLDNFDQRIHFVAPFEGEDDAHPRGLSGSAMCFHKAVGDGNLWSANLELAGVTITYIPKQRLLKSVRREAVEEFLASRYQ